MIQSHPLMEAPNPKEPLSFWTSVIAEQETAELASFDRKPISLLRSQLSTSVPESRFWYDKLINYERRELPAFGPTWEYIGSIFPTISEQFGLDARQDSPKINAPRAENGFAKFFTETMASFTTFFDESVEGKYA